MTRLARSSHPTVRDEIYWVATLSVRAGQLNHLKKLIGEMVEATSREPGALAYDFTISEDHSTVHLYEAYEDSRAAVEHMTQTFPRFASEFFECVTQETFVVYGTPDNAALELFEDVGARYMASLGGIARR